MSNYIEFGPKKLSGIRNREDPVFRVFYYFKNKRERFRLRYSQDPV